MVRKMKNEILRFNQHTNEIYQIEKYAMDKWEYEEIQSHFLSHPAQRHWWLLTRMLKGSGAREAEMMRLTPSHTERVGDVMVIHIKRGKKQDSGKTDVYSKIPLKPELSFDLDQYIRINGIKAGDRIWPYTARAYQIAFKKAAIARFGIARHPHELRGAYIRDGVDQGATVEEMGVMVGHTDTKTTLKHYFNIDANRRKDINSRIYI